MPLKSRLSQTAAVVAVLSDGEPAVEDSAEASGALVMFSKSLTMAVGMRSFATGLSGVDGAEKNGVGGSREAGGSEHTDMVRFAGLILPAKAFLMPLKVALNAEVIESISKSKNGNI